MDWHGWALFGLMATSVLTAVIIAAQMAGLSRLDLPLVLGTLVTPDPDKARVAGFFIHLAAGQGFALGYAAVFALLGQATWWLGALLGLLHVAVALTVILPLLPGVHPRMASTRAGPPPLYWNRRACWRLTMASKHLPLPWWPMSSTAQCLGCYWGHDERSSLGPGPAGAGAAGTL